MFIARPMCGIECKSRNLVHELQSAEVSRTVTTSFVWSWAISANVNEGSKLNSIQFTCISIIHCLCTANSSTLDVGIIASVCGLPQFPVLTRNSSSVPLGTISTIRSPPGPRRMQQNYLLSDARLRREEHAPMRKRARESSTTWEAIRVREWIDTAGPAFQRESRPQVWGVGQQEKQLWYPLFNKNQEAWNFPRPELEATWRTVAIIIRVILLSPYLCIRGVSISSIHYNQSRRIYWPKTPIHSFNWKLKHELMVINFPRRVAC